jgi:hypothetical protein
MRAKRYLITTHLEAIERLTGLAPGRVPPQEDFLLPSRQRAAQVQGYWFIPHPWPVDWGSRLEERWELMTWQVPPAFDRPVEPGERDLFEPLPPSGRASRILHPQVAQDVLRLLQE